MGPIGLIGRHIWYNGPIMRPKILLTLLLMALAGQSHAASKVVMVVLPAVSFEDLTSTDLPTIHKLIETGSVGLMNSRTAGRLDAKEDEYTDSKYAPESGYLTLGAGARAIAGVDARQAFNRDETFEGMPAWKVLQSRTLTDPGNAAIVHIGIAKMQHDNSDLNYEVTVGALGDALHAAGLKTAVIGNSDDAEVHREAATICMDSKGLVDFNKGRADFTVIELGNTAQLDRTRLDLMDRVYQQERAKALKEADRILGRLLQESKSRSKSGETTFMLLSPYPSSYALEKTESSLCPVIVSGPGFGHGLLTSGSTRIAGVIANTDIAPSILQMLKVPVPTSLVGRPIMMTASDSPADELLRLNKKASVQALSQPVLRQVMTAVIVLVGIVTALWLMLPVPRRKRLWPLIILPSTVAPAFLLMALWPSGNHFTVWFRLIVLAVGMTGIAGLIARKPSKALMLVSLAFAGLMLVDTLAGSMLGRNSIMGYSIVEGARYYGIGNEFMGAFLGASLVGLGLLFGALKMGRRVIEISLIIGFILSTVIVGAPMLGANVGGAISVAAGFGIALTMSRKLRLRGALSIILIAGVLVAAFAVMDSLRGQAHESHLGRAVGIIRSGGIGQIGMLVKRKLLMNVFLIRVSVWSRVLVAYGISLAVILYPDWSRISSLPMHVRIALTGLLAGTLAALIFNDSGIVAAATCFVYGWSLLMLTALEAEKTKEQAG